MEVELMNCCKQANCVHKLCTERKYVFYNYYIYPELGFMCIICRPVAVINSNVNHPMICVLHILQKSRHVLYNDPTIHYHILRGIPRGKNNSLCWYFLECEWAGQDTHIASNVHTNCRHVQTWMQDYTLTGHK